MSGPTNSLYSRLNSSQMAAMYFAPSIKSATFRFSFALCVREVMRPTPVEDSGIPRCFKTIQVGVLPLPKGVDDGVLPVEPL